MRWDDLPLWTRIRLARKRQSRSIFWAGRFDTALDELVESIVWGDT